MIVRISGLGQFELDDSAAHRLHELDKAILAAIENEQEEEFHRQLHSAITFIQETGKPVGHDRVVPSDVIVPPEDVSLDEAKAFFTDDTHLTPLPA